MITRSDVEFKLKNIQHNSEYVRVSEDHPLELYLGLNEKGCFTLRFNSPFSPVKILGNDLLEIKQVKLANYNSILFSFNSNENVALFYNFCEDIINKTYDYSRTDGYTEIVNRYNQWKKMFYGNNKNLFWKSQFEQQRGYFSQSLHLFHIDSSTYQSMIAYLKYC